MYRTSKWRVLIVLCTLMALAMPAVSVAGAVPAAQGGPGAAPAAAYADDEIVLIEANGRIRVDDPYHDPSVSQVVWNSSSQIDWVYVATGDFNADGDAEIVAYKNRNLSVFDPVIQPGNAAVQLYDANNIPADSANVLLTTGDFDGDGRDEIAVSFTPPNEFTRVLIYDGGASGVNWTVQQLGVFGAPWVAMSTGDVNGDLNPNTQLPYEDLIMVRGADNLIKVYMGPTFAVSPETQSGAMWLDVAAGMLTTGVPNQQIAALRNAPGFTSVIRLRVAGNPPQLTDLNLATDPDVNYVFDPSFTSIALGDVNGDGDEEIFLLREPADVSLQHSLIMRNPAGATIRSFEQMAGGGWKRLRTGDFDADGLYEVLILGGPKYRIYTEPATSDAITEVSGEFRLDSIAIGNIDGGGATGVGSIVVSPAGSLALQAYYGEVGGADISVRNNAPGKISWKAEVTGGMSWLRVNDSLLATGETPDNLRITGDTRNQIPGDTLLGTIRLYAGDGTTWNAGFDYSVSLKVLDPGTTARPYSLVFFLKPGQTQTQMMRISKYDVPNTTTDTVGWSIAELPMEAMYEVGLLLDSGAARFDGPQIKIDNQPMVPAAVDWLSYTPDTGTVPPAANVAVEVNATGLPLGRYTAQMIVAVQSPTPQYIYVPVTLVVTNLDVSTIYQPYKVRPFAPQ